MLIQRTNIDMDTDMDMDVDVDNLDELLTWNRFGQDKEAWSEGIT